MAKDDAQYKNIADGREHEFLTDAQLPDFYRAKLDALKPDDPDVDAVRAQLSAAEIAATMTGR